MKIDLVYLWVDGSDEKWLAKKNAVLKSLGRMPANHAIANKRWTDHYELLYSLRSAEKFAPWLNHIFIVTDNQMPKWLNLNNPKITIIDHKEIIPNEFLPLFNSRAIEYWLHKIPNLSEYFLYSNDDMFFGKPVEPSFFFDENKNPILIYKESDNKKAFTNKETNKNWKKAKWNALRLVEKEFNLQYNISFRHIITPMRKSYMKDIAENFYSEIIEPTMTPFREPTNVQRIVFSMIDNAKKRNTIVLNWRVNEKRIVYDVQKSGAFQRFFHKCLLFFAMIFGFVKYDCYDRPIMAVHFLKKYKPTTFAISAVWGKFDSRAKFLKEMFTNKSEFEK